ncbi:DUF1870 family protein [Gilliamella sp. B3482]|uniref:Aca2/YdiL-like domain-containing protein n=1 Tax=Gilliamella sp. B3482 TaxID=2817991 RepID=UPI002269DF2C|nr:DUF1870 family protein [Gilliamella sp. B3482]MCX8580078.1 DUF1870 family protein [Gilliamella sp. B3482]
MTNVELKALRRLFFLDVSEAAQFIGDCHVRTWQRWEQGTRKIPEDVIKMMNLLKEDRQEILAMLLNKTYKDVTTNDLLNARLVESVKAELLAKNIIDNTSID